MSKPQFIILLCVVSVITSSGLLLISAQLNAALVKRDASLVSVLDVKLSKLIEIQSTYLSKNALSNATSVTSPKEIERASAQQSSFEDNHDAGSQVVENPETAESLEAFYLSESVIDQAIYDGSWTSEAVNQITPFVTFLTPKQRTYLASKLMDSVNDGTINVNDLAKALPPF